LAAAVHRRATETAKRFLLGQPQAIHQAALGPLDHLAFLQRLLELPRLAIARDGEIKRRRQLGRT